MCNIGGRSTWQRMPLGVMVVCRGWPWRVAHVEESSSRVLAVDVLPAAGGAPTLSTFLTPFDRIRVRSRAVGWRRASRHRVRHAVATLGGAWPEIPLASIAAAATVPWPHQLVPALAMLQGRGVRVLVADDVGLGKTVAAGVAIAELAARDLAARVLVLTPAGLRDQWQSELWRHLSIAADVVDAGRLADITREVPAGCSPWIGSGIRILSLDFAKQPTVLRSLAEDTWEVLVIDEVHIVSGDSQRAAAVRALARQSRVVLLLSATPHSGLERSFRKLVSIGVHDAQDPLIWIRRGRAELGFSQSRRSRAWRLRPTAAEIELDRALHAYASRVDKAKRPEARLAMIVLKKRALSSPDALLCSLQRRLAGVSGTDEPVAATTLLPFTAGETDDGDDPQPAVLGAGGLGDVGDEQTALRAVIEVADRARQAPSKYRVLQRLVTRTAEAIILFTEYRDTLRAVASRLSALTTVATLHGGLDREARRDVLRRFTHGEARILVATDAAAEGLNLQSRCRFVVHLDLPWSPTTLAQRVGRVDRIGQSRQVREWQLTGAGSHERAVVAALARRFQQIQRDLGGAAARDWRQASNDIDAVADADAGTWRAGVNDLGEIAANVAFAAGRIRALRETCSAAVRQSRRAAVRQDCQPRGVPWIRSRRAAPIVGPGVVFLFTSFPRLRGESQSHVAVHVALETVPRESPKTWLPWLLTPAAQLAKRSLPSADLLRARAEARERDLLAQAEIEHRRLQGRWQPSLFDERAARVIGVARDRIDRRTSTHAQRLVELRRIDDGPLVEPVLALIVE